MRLIIDMWNRATYRSAPVRDARPPRPTARPQVEELELLLLEVDPRTRRIRIAAVRRPT